VICTSSNPSNSFATSWKNHVLTIAAPEGTAVMGSGDDTIILERMDLAAKAWIIAPTSSSRVKSSKKNAHRCCSNAGSAMRLAAATRAHLFLIHSSHPGKPKVGMASAGSFSIAFASSSLPSFVRKVANSKIKSPSHASRVVPPGDAQKQPSQAVSEEGTCDVRQHRRLASARWSNQAANGPVSMHTLPISPSPARG
jgi:hypothetical protein